jgi:hypothetical protein
MDQICLVVPITPGKAEDARDFMPELEGQRKPDYGRSERRIGITKEAWYLARTPGGDQFVAYGKPRLRPGPVPVLRVARRVRPVVQAPPGRLHRP